MGSARLIHIHKPAEDREQEILLDPQDVIEDYLDHLCAPLVGLVPFETRDRFKEEVRENLQGRYESLVEEGMNPELAIREAINKYGPSEEMSRRFLDEWLRYEPKGTIHRAFGIANGWALIFFGQATLWCLILAQLRIFFPSPAPYAYGVPLENIRSYVPQPIPIPDASPWTYLFLAFVLIVPIIAGYFVGRLAVAHAARGVLQVMAYLTLGTFFMGTIMVPVMDGLFLALAQLVWWLPVGCLTAHATAAMVWRRRCASHSFPTRRKS